MSSGSNSRKRGVGKVDGSTSPPQAKVAKGTHPFFLGTGEKNSGSFVWKKPIGDSCLHGVHLNPLPSSKIAAWDLDGTLIKTSSGNNFPRDRDDWMWWHACVRKKLAELHEQGFTIVIFSNQASSRKKTIEEWKLKIPLIASQLPDVPFRIFAAQQHDVFRKPMPGMWHEFGKINQQVKIDEKLSFFVGDAAGRPGDHSDSDRKWAINVELPFFTPEEYFLGSSPAAFKLQGFDPSSFPNDGPRCTSPLIPTLPTRPEVVIFVGYPASGKTSFYRRYFRPAGYEHVNQDVLKTRGKCIKAVENLIRSGQSCVVDNTNRNTETRKEYIEICRRLGAPVRCIYFSVSLQLCWHNNLYRAFCRHSPGQVEEPGRALLPQMAFTSFRANFEEPNAAEGFMEIKRVDFRFEGTEQERKRWNMWLEIDKTGWLTSGG